MTLCLWEYKGEENLAKLVANGSLCAEMEEAKRNFEAN